MRQSKAVELRIPRGTCNGNCSETASLSDRKADNGRAIETGIRTPQSGQMPIDKLRVSRGCPPVAGGLAFLTLLRPGCIALPNALRSSCAGRLHCAALRCG
jgi:hypothetical protein